MTRTAVVTGGARGIGAATVRALAAAGWNVWVHYHTSDRAARLLADEIGVFAVQADLRDPTAIAAMFDKVGDVDLLVNNAGIAHAGLMTDTDADTWRDLFTVNVDAAYHCIQQVLPGMIRRKHGVIINVSSIWGMTGASCEVAYSATKAALIGLTKALAKEVGPSGVRVNAVAPGVIDTDMLGGFTADERSALCAETPLLTIGRAEDVAHLVEFLASDRARFITGQVISPNGGLVI